SGQADFHRFGGTTVKVPMMRRDEDITLLRTPSYDAALLPYKGGRFSAVLLVPHAILSPKDFSSFLSLAMWNSALLALHSSVGSSLAGTCDDRQVTDEVSVGCRGTLVMPKFKLDYKKDLTETLGTLGMSIPAGLPEFCGDCSLSKVVQKTYL